MSNRLQYETSPYLLQHRDNPVDWYPWGEEAFERAKQEDKPIFLSIGYSTCHWCHVLAHESFEDQEIAEILNRYFVSVKVDREERPDVDSVYMAVCQAFTGSGGWPTSIFMTPDKEPFFAGTYFPKTARGGMIGMKELLLSVHQHWQSNREALLQQSKEILRTLNPSGPASGDSGENLLQKAVGEYKAVYDRACGGFGSPPKFPTPHNLLFLLTYYERYGDKDCLEMAEHTLLQMYRGGLFDHVGFGFCRYSTDRRFLVPHFEKMLYDNALLILAYCKAYEASKNPLYLEIAEKTAEYIRREMTSCEGGFFSAQDADSEGEEGKFYLFTPQEITDVLGKEQGNAFCRHFDVTPAGNFEGKSIPNLLKSDEKSIQSLLKSNEKSISSLLKSEGKSISSLLKREGKSILNPRRSETGASWEPWLAPLREYRRNRYSLSLDDKILTAWNSLMIAALCRLFLVSKKSEYLDRARRADAFLQAHLQEDGRLFVSYRAGKRGVSGFLDDYGCCILAQLSLYRATLEEEYLTRARDLQKQVFDRFSAPDGGFYLYGRDSESLPLRPKETFDGAIPSGNSMMAYTLVQRAWITGDEKDFAAAKKQLEFLTSQGEGHPTARAMFLWALLESREPPMKITVVLDGQTSTKALALKLPPEALVSVRNRPTEEFPLRNGKTTYYICRGHRCLPPTNDLPSGGSAKS